MSQAADPRGPAPGGFPWGDNRPTRRQRFIVAFFIAGISATLQFFRAIENGGRSDFAPLWHAARLALGGQNPYELIGPGNVVESAWPVFYPATAFVVAAPFTLIPSFHFAASAFIFVSAFLLAWGITADGWHRLPIFPSIAYLTSATLAQWSILMTAMVFLPFLGFIAAAKPQGALPIIASAASPRTLKASIIGGIVLLAVSLIMLPTWPQDWLGLLGTTDNFIPPVMRFAGPLILLVMLRWRRPEAWLVLIAACMPQTWPPYNGLLLMTVALTYRETAMLSLVSSLSWIIWAWFVDGLTLEQEKAQMSMILNLSSYLPATFLILRRPNTGPSPAWLAWILGLVAGRQAGTKT